MAITQMAKVIIVSHRTQATELLEALQREGICQILNAEEAMVSKDSPELAAAAERPKDIEEMLNRLIKGIAFLESYAKSAKSFASVLSPRTVIDEQSYNNVVSDRQILNIIDRCEQVEATIEKTKGECENLAATLELLEPWASLETPVEEIGQLRTTTCLAGLIPARQFEQVQEQLTELGGAIQQVGTTADSYACIIVCLKVGINDVQKLLRSAEFEPVNFGSMTGTVAESFRDTRERLDETRERLQARYKEAASLSRNLLKLQILHDHYENLLNREQARGTAPTTEHTVLLEGWVKKVDLPRLEKIVSGFDASSLSRIKPAEDEEVPVEIENKSYIRPFEVITRLYGMPQHFEVDPTVFLAPFFALFFGLCLTDAGYGLIMVVAAIYLMRKLQGDKKFAVMMLICSITTVVCGALTGGWFGNAIQLVGIPWLVKARLAILKFGFDPMETAESAKIFFYLALALGYIQLLFGNLIAFYDKLLRKQYVSAICAHFTWFIMLNCLVAYGFSRKNILVSEELGQMLLRFAIVPALAILLFSHNEGSWVARLGMGTFNLVGVIFYIGDTLSYVRLMALGMVTAGFAVAVNQFGTIAGEVKYVGPILAVVILLIGHSFNMGISALGAFVHTLRLQYVEFFPKFLTGGGRLFQPLVKQNKYIYISK